MVLGLGNISGIYMALLAGESPTCILHESTHPIIRAIEVSHAAFKAEFGPKKHFWLISQLECIFIFIIYIFYNIVVVRLSLGKLLVNLLQVVKWTNTPLIP